MSSQVHGIHFFKVILETTLRKGELKVPTTFARKHWHEMSNPVILSLPNGTKKKVYWLKHDGDVWFCNGWKEFAEYSRLEASHFVVFRYEGNSSFNVIIFGKSAVEVEYPLSSDEVEIRGTHKTVEERSSLRGKRKKSPPPLSRTSKKVLIRPKEEVPEEEEDEPNHCEKRPGLDNPKYIDSGSSGADFKRSIRNFHEKVKTMFHSDKQHFTCAIQKSYIERDLLILPVEFSKQYLHKEDATLFIEEVSWDVKLKVNYYTQLTFALGWRKFLLDNKLKVGDVCGFELQNYKGFAFKVTIFRFEEDSSSPLLKGQEGLSHRPSSSSFKTSVTPKASTSKPNDYLYVIIKPPINSPTVSFNYIKRYVRESGRYVTLRVGCTSWRVKLLFYERNFTSRFSSGWVEFLRGCDLKEGDTCVFKMIDEENLEFEVSFLRGKTIHGYT